jgi:hypothetical protein
MYGTKPVKLTSEEILKRVSYWDLWSYYIPGVELKKKFLSPLRVEKRPSCSLFVTGDGVILMKDFNSGTYTIWKFLQERYGLTYAECLLTINNDFNLKLATPKIKPTMAYYGIVKQEQPKLISERAKIQIKRREWNKADQAYWGKYNLDIEFISKRGVLPLQNFWVNEYLIYWYNEYNPAYSYEFGNKTRKIYLPFDSKQKFIGNASDDILQGEDYLPWIDDVLFITKGYKDALVLSKLGYNSIAPQSESCTISIDKMNTLKHRFETIYLLYDNDSTGIKYSEKICNHHNLIPIFVPNGQKDISDYIEAKGKKETLKLIKSWMILKKPKEL